MAELVQVAVVVHQPVEADDRRGIAFLGFVLGDERGQRLLGLAGQDLPHALQTELLDRSARLAAAPGVEGAELGDQRGPVGFGQRCLVAEERLDGGGCSVASAPAQAGLTPCASGSALSAPTWASGKLGDVRVRGGQVLGPQREEFLLITIQRVHRPRVESGQAAAGKVVLHFRFDRFDGGSRRLGVRAERQQRRRCLPPSSTNRSRPPHRRRTGPPWPG